MKAIIPILFLFLLSCAPQGTITLTQTQLDNAVSGTIAPLDTLHAYRKAPGQPQTVTVQGHYRHDSTYIKPHTRSARRTKSQMPGVISQ